MEWEPDGPSPCEGTLGHDVAALTAKRGSLSGIRRDQTNGLNYRGADLSSADLTCIQLKVVTFGVSISGWPRSTAPSCSAVTSDGPICEERASGHRRLVPATYAMPTFEEQT